MQNPHAHRLRAGRVSIPGQAYLITAVTDHRRLLFGDLYLSRKVIQTLYSLPTHRLVETLAYVLMPDHLHWLLVLKEGSINEAVQRFKSYTARAVNRHYGFSGAVWQKGFHDHALRKDEDFQAVARYIVANPLRKGIVQSVGDYPHWDAVWLQSDLNDID